MSIFTRASDIIQANVNALLDKAEQPEKMVRLMIQEMEEAIVELRGLAAQQIAEQKRIDRERDNCEKSINQWQAKAEKALDHDREDLARAALEHKLQATQRLESLGKEADYVANQLAPLSADIERLQVKLIEARTKERELHKRLDSVAVKLRSQQIKSADAMNTAMSRYENYERRVEELEAKLEAFDIGSTNPSLEQQFRDLEHSETIDTELAALKAKSSKKA